MYDDEFELGTLINCSSTICWCAAIHYVRIFLCVHSTRKTLLRDFSVLSGFSWRQNIWIRKGVRFYNFIQHYLIKLRVFAKLSR